MSFIPNRQAIKSDLLDPNAEQSGQ